MRIKYKSPSYSETYTIDTVEAFVVKSIESNVDYYDGKLESIERVNSFQSEVIGRLIDALLTRGVINSLDLAEILEERGEIELIRK